MQKRYALPWIIGCGLVIILAIVAVGIAVTINRSPENSSEPDSQTTTKLRQIATDMVAPVGIASTKQSGDGRLFIVGQDGKIMVINKDRKEKPKLFLDISGKVQYGGEMGLLGLAFDPNFAANGYFYVNYVDKLQITHIARFTARGDKADPSSEKQLIELLQPYTNHNGGDLQFGNDGYLYIALGDGGSGGDPENRAQTLGSLFGKILRIDVHRGDPYAIPDDNPFRSQQDARPEIWAYGLRNPWRFSFDRQTHDMYIGDVGQGAVEEVDFQAADSKGGENYGWRCYEGGEPFKLDGCKAANAYISPIITYKRVEPRCSVTGGYVYRGTHIQQLIGSYLYGDFCSGEVFAATKERLTWRSERLFDTSFRISTFGEDSNGEIYLADLSGSIYKLVAE